MRRSLLLLGFSVLAIACFGSGSTNGPPDASFGGPDGSDFDGTTSDVEQPEGAAEAAALDGPAQDGTTPPAEAGKDAVSEATVDAGSPVTVNVIGFRGVEPLIPVVFQDAAGNVVAGSATMTDSNGNASGLVPPGGSVTVITGTVQPSLFTVLAPPAGATIQVYDWSSAALTSVALTSVPLPLPPLAGGDASAPYVNWSFGGRLDSLLSPPPPSPLVQVSGPPVPSFGLGRFGATVGAAMPSVVEATNLSGSIAGYVFAKDVALAGALDDAGNLEVAAPGPWNAPVLQTIGNVATADGGAGLNGEYFSEGADGTLVPILSSPLALHPLFADFLQMEAQLGTATTYFQQVYVQRLPVPSTSGTLSIDATSAAAAPTFTTASAALVPADAGAGLEPTVTWALSSGDLGSTTGVVALGQWSVMGDAGVSAGTWTLVSPGTAQASIHAPPLPASLASYGPPAGASLSLANVYAIGGTAVPTYPDLLGGLASSFWPVAGCYGQAIVPPLPKDGSAVVILWAPNASGC